MLHVRNLDLRRPIRFARTVQVHPQERLLQEARAYQQTEELPKAFGVRDRVVIEYTLARLSHLGIGQARYSGRAKTRCQLLMACTVAYLRRIGNWLADQQASEPAMAACPGYVRSPACPGYVSGATCVVP